MRIESITAAGFRSIRNASLNECGELNVLIGKNNSGKSNILAAIQTFFEFFTLEGRVATPSPRLNSDNDWHQKDIGGQINISATLDLTPEELDELKESIATEAPQVRNALLSADLTSFITVELSFTPPPRTVGYISLIRFGGPSDRDAGIIYSARTDSATQIAENLTILEESAEIIELIDRISTDVDEDYWRRLRDYGQIPGSARYAPTRMPDTLRTMARSAPNLKEFQASCRDYYDRLTERIDAVGRQELDAPVQTFSGSATVIPEYVTSVVRKIAELRVHSLSEQRNPIGQKEASRILKLKTSRGQGDVLRGIQSVVAGLLGVQIDAFSSDTPQPSRQTRTVRPDGIPAELDVDDFLVQLNGSGIRESLRLILDREFERPDVLLVEEPEVHLHPALEIALMQYLKTISSECQVFLTTHSTNFLDVGSLKNVYLIRKEAETSIQRVDVDEAESSIPEELGLRLSSLFMFDRLAFVEGPSDEQILRIFAEKLGINFAQASLGFVTTGGARNFTHFATSSTLSFLRKRNVRTLFILDRDERNARDLEIMREKVEGLSEVRLLDRRELENYLVCPTALARYIAIKSGGKHNPSADQVAAEIDNACDDLFIVAVERRVLKHACRPIIPNRESVLRRGSLEFETALRAELESTKEKLDSLLAELSDVIATENSNVQADWDRKSHLVPGDEIIDRVFSRYGMRFGKKRDAVEIAQIMTRDEIPADIRETIANLVI
ncbi:ATP-dependent endonuclease [Kitasatospora sp. NPDC056531]|uniref:ATP-dependent nuclease n=1 Tax=Kitasatospora sp. NPDC056531 TaxID=3345856 RepID=UPI0036D1A491